MPFISVEFWHSFISLVYFSFAAIVVLLVVFILWRAKPKSRLTWAWVPFTVLVFSYPPASSWYRNWQDAREFSAKSAAQIAHFEMRCKSAGEKIYQSVKGVEGIFIMKPRIKPTETLYQSQWELWDPYGTSGYEASYPAALLVDERFEGHRQQGIMIPPIKGLRFVEISASTRDQTLSESYRRVAIAENDKGERLSNERRTDWILTSEPVHTLRSRYGITWDDISTREDREKWIAGGRLQIVEFATGAVIAERIGYMREPGLGSLIRNRSAWLFAERYACPAIRFDNIKDKIFIAKVFGLTVGE